MCSASSPGRGLTALGNVQERWHDRGIRSLPVERAGLYSTGRET